MTGLCFVFSGEKLSYLMANPVIRTHGQFSGLSFPKRIHTRTPLTLLQLQEPNLTMEADVKEPSGFTHGRHQDWRGGCLVQGPSAKQECSQGSRPVSHGLFQRLQVRSK